MISRRSYALASVVLLMILWGSTFVVTKATVREIPPLTLAVLRFLIAAAVLAPVVAARGGLKSLPRPLPLIALTLMSLSGIAIFTVAFNYALVYGSASQGALIFALVPAAVAIAAVIGLREKLSKRRIAGIVLSVCGVALVAAAGERDGASPDPLLGALCMLGAVVAWAGYTVIAKQLSDVDQIVVIACVSAIGMAMLLPFAALELLLHARWPSPSLEGWLGMAFLGVVASAVAFIIYSRALRELDASIVGAYLNLDPIVGVLTAVLFRREIARLADAGRRHCADWNVARGFEGHGDASRLNTTFRPSCILRLPLAPNCERSEFGYCPEGWERACDAVKRGAFPNGSAAGLVRRWKAAVL